MKYILYALTILYAVLCVIAAVSQLKSAKEKDTPASMLAGSAILLGAVLMQELSGSWGWLFAIAGGIMIFVCALQNGRRSGKLHIRHHVIRGGFTALLVLGFLLL